MTYYLILKLCAGLVASSCVPVVMPGGGYASEKLCRENVILMQKRWRIDDSYCLPRPNETIIGAR